MDPSQSKTAVKLYNDPIHGSIELNALEQAIINTPEFYRLKNIKQLGGTVHVYPGATHTRFEHSIGVCYIAGEFIQHLRKKIDHINKNREEKGLKKLEENIEILPKEEYCVRVAALCHDLGHGAFSHLFESIAKRIVKDSDVKVLKHEDMSKRILEKILDRPSVKKTFEEVFGLKDPKYLKMIKNMIGIEKGFEIVANKDSGVDVDKWDYFARDCHYLGVTNDFDWRRCMKLSTIVKGDDGNYHIGFAIKEKNNLMGMFRTRCVLHQKAYQHEVANGIEMMITDILVCMKDEPMIRTENGYKSLSAILQEAFKEDAAKADLSGYLALTDSILDLICNYECGDESSDAETRDIKKLFNDPIHGSIELNALEQTIINTPEFHRLKDIKQLGGTVHVYPGATHTRFEHSIGVCYIAGEMIQHLRKKIKISLADELSEWQLFAMIWVMDHIHTYLNLLLERY